MKCLNSRGCYNKDAVSLAFAHNGKYIATDNFCSIECYLIYSGERDPPKKEHRTYDDPERQLIHNIYFKHFCDGISKKKPGVKLGIKRGSYKKPKIIKLDKRQKERDRKKRQRERVRKHREHKKRSEIKRRQKLILEGV